MDVYKILGELRKERANRRIDPCRGTPRPCRDRAGLGDLRLSRSPSRMIRPAAASRFKPTIRQAEAASRDTMGFVRLAA